MTARMTTPRERIGGAVAVLRGRRPPVDYGLLLVMPFLAAAGGVLVSMLIEDAVERRRDRGREDRGFTRGGRGARPPAGAV
ncbi:hypothetical protein Ani05nite_06810 [Amorphoplanes nipponensis]|uniref:Uncharacterized protein n=1 Tax=Actinoplanes nipponensis TaxID=135950 RepID=A0A919JCN3_9ACTN|nr:hypothetical protein [Actinoplanes nipponensis]GIE47147.1 hypothetical protein Ani05nite_06810 [Actinoplanes nipponensis]